MVKIKYAKGSDGKVLFCWRCKEKIKKDELVYLGYASKRFGIFGKPI